MTCIEWTGPVNSACQLRDIKQKLVKSTFIVCFTWTPDFRIHVLILVIDLRQIT